MSAPEMNVGPCANGARHQPHLWMAPGRRMTHCAGVDVVEEPEAAYDPVTEMGHALEAMRGAYEELRRRVDPGASAEKAFDHLSIILNAAPGELRRILSIWDPSEPVEFIASQFELWLRKRATEL